MNRRTFLKVSGTAVLGSKLLASTTINDRRVPSSRRPNLVFVFPDQFRIQALGFMKEDPVKTPNLDRFAEESRVFINAVSNRPLCTPYRGMLMTGRWPYSTGLTTNANSSQPDVYLRESEQTFTDVLAESGYTVGYLGKWHLDTPQGVPVAMHWQDAVWDAYTPPGPKRHGISFWYAYGCSDDHLNPHYWVGGAAEEEKIFPGEYSPIHEAKAASSFIANENGEFRDPDKPFAVFVAMNPPHPPYELVPEVYRQHYADQDTESLLNRPNVSGRRGHQNVQDYFSAVTAVDEAFGSILDAIHQAGLEDDTIVVFTADHGEMMGGHGLMQKVVPYEESLRIPFLIRWPNRVKPGQESLHLNVPDTMPSLLSLMGLKEQIPAQVEGTDYSAAFQGHSLGLRPQSTLYLRCGEGVAQARGVRTDRYTFVLEMRRGNVLYPILFDNQADPYQVINIASRSPEIVAELSQELNRWLKKTKDPHTDDFILK